MKSIENADTPNVQYEISDPLVIAITPVVSVQMITYNHGPYLAEAIEGVIAQKTDFPIELIIGEDCSTDNTRDIALDYQRRYPQLIRVIYSDRNVGMIANGRRVRAACRGEFIAFCEGDDYWVDQEKLCIQVDILSRYKNIDLTFHSCYLRYENCQKKFLSCVHSSRDKLIELSKVISGDGGFMPTASLLVRRNLLLSFQDWFDDKIPVGDYFLQVFGSQRGGAYYLNKPMSVYRKNVGGSWVQRTKKIDALIEFEKKFYYSLRQLEYLIPEQKNAFNRIIVSHFSGRFIAAKNMNCDRLMDVALNILKDRMHMLSHLQKIKVFLLQKRVFVFIFPTTDLVLHVINKHIIRLGLK
ncbi:MAG TPA: glycosyltransferase [Candidatus Competibacter sp.]|nr:glycosyltransferase [Candidatus Competibacter sp.]